MAKIAPSILAADFANLERDIHDIEKNGSDWVHVDVMDGMFVPNITFGVPVVKSLRKVTDLPLDVHLMINRPIRYIGEFCRAGADWVTIHVESDTEENNHVALRVIRSLGAHPAISLKPGTAPEVLKPYLKEVDMILVMTVEPGFGGQKFMYDQMAKTRTLRSWLDAVNPDCLIEVDGGVDVATVPICKEHGVNVMVTGSAYFKAPDRARFVQYVQAEVPSFEGEFD
ncbi:MAG: ribulose-phosphate 3-epimerase [Oscillospiraceae bacterium]|nr:ribulose-phosphate 3-epimerase [Oscillospiraceae bacterium]